MRRHLLTHLFALLLSADTLQAQTQLFQDRFDAGIHRDWTLNSDAYFNGGVRFESQAGGLRFIVPPASAPYYAAGGYSAGVTYRTNLIYEDFSMALDVVQTPATASTAVGVQARMQGLAFTDDNLMVPFKGSGYTLLTFPVPDDFSRQVLQLNRADDQIPAPDFLLRTSFPRIPGRQYRLVFTGRGDHLVGSIYDQADPATPLATVQGHDARYRSGTVGIVALSIFGALHVGNEPVDATVDNFAVAVPEPLHSFVEDFDDGSDANPGYARYDLFGSLGAPAAAFTFADGALSIEAPASVAPQASAAFAGSTLITPTFSDVESSADIQGWNESPDARPVVYLTARGREVGQGVYDFYLLSLAPTAFPEAANGYDSRPVLTIGKVINNVNQLPPLATTPLTNIALKASNAYQLRFSVQGDSLRGWLFDRIDPTRPLAEVSARDSSLQSGYTGFVATDRGVNGEPRLNSPVRITVDNFRVRGTPAAPSLAVERAVMLSWPVSASGYRVEGALRAEGPWSELGTVPSFSDGMNVVTHKVTTPMTLFRLRKPFLNE